MNDKSSRECRVPSAECREFFRSGKIGGWFYNHRIK
jgi:hypothetical protein